MTTDFTPHDGEHDRDGIDEALAMLKRSRHPASPALILGVRRSIRRRLFAIEVVTFLWSAPVALMAHFMQVLTQGLGVTEGSDEHGPRHDGGEA